MINLTTQKNGVFFMKMILSVIVTMFIGTASANELVKKCQAYDADKCYESAMENQKAGKGDEAKKLLEAACINTHKPSCHMLGLMLTADKADKESVQKGKAFLKKACDMKYKFACDDLKKL